MAPRPSFQYRRASSRLGHSRLPTASALLSTPLQNLTDRHTLPQAVSRKTSLPSSRRLSIAEPPAKKSRQKKKKNARYKQIRTDVSEEQRLKLLLDAVMLEEYDEKYANASNVEREQFEEATLKVSDFLDALVTDIQSTGASFVEMRKPNPMTAELEQQAVQLEEIIKNYKVELEKWESVEKESTKPVEVPSITDVPDAELPAECPDPAELMKTSADAIESYILQTDHLRNILRKLENRNRETHSRVQAVAVALNSRVMSEFGQRADGNLTPPPNLATVKVGTVEI